MPATPKSLRQAPPRRFENYILTRVTSADAGLTPVNDSQMTQIIGGNVDDGSSGLTDIGFDFSFDGVVYKRFFANANGWLALAGPTETSTATIQTELLLSASYQNQGINLNNASQNVLLCPWFDDLRTVASDINNLPLTYSSTKIGRINEGLEVPPIIYNPVESGVNMYRDTRSPLGRRTIVRWSALSNFANASTVIRFEAVLYENGRIEFRYTPRKKLALTDTKDASGNFIEAATIGIFMPGTNRFRDFALGLGYNDGARQRYIYGGAPFISTFFDSGIESFPTPTFISRQYVWRLRPAAHWPGLNDVGAAMVFQPPLNRRHVLPRSQQRVNDSALSMPTVARTGDFRHGNDSVSFDDRTVVLFMTASAVSGTNAGVVVNYPTTLQRFYGDSEPGIVDRQDLFSGDFELTAAFVNSAASPWVGNKPKAYVEPFSETARFENDPFAADNPFYSGSSIDALGLGLSQPLKAKTQLRMSFPVEYKTKLFGVSSSVYYFNRRASFWEVPQNSTYVIATGSTSVPAGTTKGDIRPMVTDFSQARIIEDARVFGPIGNVVSSGSHVQDSSFPGDQTDASIGATYTPENVTIALGKLYAKSVQVNEDYRATDDETFTPPINQPFLLEKAVFEVPIEAGDGWFKDMTTSFQPLDATTGSFDFAGPALTVALFNQLQIGSVTRRDLVVTGTITHSFDNVATIVFSNFPSLDSTYQIRPAGFRAFGGSVPGAVVTAVSTSVGYQFTGSVAVPCTAMVSNGVTVRLTRLMNSATASLNRQGVLDLFGSPFITLGDVVTTNYVQKTRIAYINTFGRGATGFDPSGRSVFGKEFVASQAVSVQGRISNPLLLTGSPLLLSSVTSGSLPAQFVAAIQSGTNFASHVAIPLESHAPSPYLIMPGDKLVLAVSKTRPFAYGDLSPTPYTSGSVTHDIKLSTGSINITLYGSLLKEGQEYHDTLNPPLASEAIHEVFVGNDPVLDQYETSYREVYAGGTYDNYVTGSLITKVKRPDGQTAFVTGTIIGVSNGAVVSTGSRGRAFSKLSARSAPTDGYGGDIANTNPSEAQRQEQWYERVGSVRVAPHTCNTERFWDSLMPAINQCFNADGTGIFLISPIIGSFTTVGDPNQVDHTVGYMWFDFQAPQFFPNAAPLLNGNWTWAYPYEPRYASVPRQRSIENSFVANYLVDFSTGFTSGPTATAIVPTPVQGFIFGPAGTQFPSVPAVTPASASILTTSPYGKFNYNWVCDSYVNSKLPGPNHQLTSSARLNDTLRALFGFGDLNNITYVSAFSDNGAYPGIGGARFGTNHFADFRLRKTDNLNWGSQWGISPLIRGWKYGVYSGLPAFSKTYFRQGHYGQFRDMLEQRPFTKYYSTPELDPNVENFHEGPNEAAVTIRFVDSAGKITQPENTSSQNLSFEATSSVPYFDGTTRNRPPIVTDTLNSNVIALKFNQFSNITL